MLEHASADFQIFLKNSFLQIAASKYCKKDSHRTESEFFSSKIEGTSKNIGLSSLLWLSFVSRETRLEL